MSIPASLSPFANFSVTDENLSAHRAQIPDQTSCKRNPGTLDVLCITTLETEFKDVADKLTIQAQSSDVPIEVLYVEMLEGTSKKEKTDALIAYLHRLDQDKAIDDKTQIIVHLHGISSGGSHYVANVEKTFSFGTLQLVSLIREALGPADRADGAAGWNGTVHLSACGVGSAANSVSNVRGLNLLYGGRKTQLTIDSEDIFIEIIRLLGEYRKDPEKNPFPTTEQFYRAAGSVSGEKVSLSGNGKLFQIGSGFFPSATDLLQPMVMTKLEKCLIAKLMHGKTANFRKVVDLLGVAVQHVKFAPPFHVLVISAPDDAEEKLKILLEAGVNINQLASFGKTALHQAVSNKNKEMLKLLIRYGADINRRDARGDSPLGFALRSRQSDVAECLIEAGADIQAVTGSNESALQVTVVTREIGLLKRLLAKGANPLAQDDLKECPLLVAVMNNHVDLVELMLPHVPLSTNLEGAIDQPALTRVLSWGKEKIFLDMLNRYPDKPHIMIEVFKSVAREIEDNRKSDAFNIKIFDKHKLMVGIIIKQFLTISPRMPGDLKNMLIRLNADKDERYMGLIVWSIDRQPYRLKEKWLPDFEELAAL